jgi:hypothetical protein
MSVSCDVLERPDVLASQSLCDGQGGVAEGCEHLRRCAGAGSALVLAAAHVARRVQAVLDAPKWLRDRVAAWQSQQLASVCFCGGLGW